MRKFVVISICALAAGSIAGPAAAKAPKCEAKYYGYLVGKDISEAQTISSGEYRLVRSDRALAAGKPGQMTIRYDNATNRIVTVSCE
jgi:hypothetical protein